jgi:phage terminase large subunit
VLVNTYDFNFKNPDYLPIIKRRIELLQKIRVSIKEDDKFLPTLRVFYRENPAQFICDWGTTYDPRNVERGLPAQIPFILFDKQIEFVDYVIRKWKSQSPGLVEKSRDMGVSWLSTSLACTLCLFYEGMAIGFGSRKEEYVDKIGSPKSLFFKARMFMSNIPKELSNYWDIANDAPYMRVNFPLTGSYISGEAGDNIGRGDRSSIYIVDEASYLERPELVEASLSQTTNCRIDVSSAHGMANPFAQKRHSGKIEVLTLHWRDDPRKDEAWYAKQCEELDPVTVAQEIDINYSASVEGVLIPNAWVQAAIDAHIVLGIQPTGAKFGSLDVADEGIDTNAFCGAHGILIEELLEWSGKGDDIFGTVQRAFGICDNHGYVTFRYDADGLGAGVRGDARVINDQRVASNRKLINVEAFRGSAGVFAPEVEDVKGRKNQDFFANMKAQAWWSLRARFQRTYRAVKERFSGVSYDEIISIPSSLPLRQKLVMELSQPTYSINTVGKVVVDKTPDGAKSPNLADAVMIRFAIMKHAPIHIADDVLLRSRKLMGNHRR